MGVWVRLLKLPVEYYAAEILAKIGKSMESLLRVDNATSAKSRGKYARFCIQVNLDEPLREFIVVEGKKRDPL